MGAWTVRVVLAAGLVGSAWVHYDLWRLGYRDIDVIGPLFLLNIVAGAVIAVAVLVWRHWLPALAAAGFGIATLGAYATSATVGLFGHQNEWFAGDREVWAAVTEVVCIIGGAALLAMRRRRARASVGLG